MSLSPYGFPAPSPRDFEPEFAWNPGIEDLRRQAETLELRLKEIQTRIMDMESRGAADPAD